MSQKVNIKKLNPDACIPTYGTAFSAGADLYSGMPEALIIRLISILEEMECRLIRLSMMHIL